MGLATVRIEPKKIRAECRYLLILISVYKKYGLPVQIHYLISYPMYSN